MIPFFDRPAWQLAIFGGIITGIAYQPWHLGFLAWIGLIPLLHIWLNHDANENARYGYLFGMTVSESLNCINENDKVVIINMKSRTRVRRVI